MGTKGSSSVLVSVRYLLLDLAASTEPEVRLHNLKYANVSSLETVINYHIVSGRLHAFSCSLPQLIDEQGSRHSTIILRQDYTPQIMEITDIPSAIGGAVVEIFSMSISLHCEFAESLIPK
jgi:hypothetical protein